jgi:hypothetical protein
VQSAPLRGRGTLAVREWAAQCHGAGTGHVAQFPTVAGMGFPYGVGGTAPERDSQARDGAALLCQSIKCPYPRAGAGALVHEPSSEADPARGRRRPSSEAEPARGGVILRARRNPLEVA